MDSAIVGVAPQNAVTQAAGVSLTRAERTFFDALVSAIPNYADEASDSLDSDDTPSPFSPDDPFGVVVPTDYIPGARAKKPYVKKERRDYTMEELMELGKRCHLRPIDVTYIKEWVIEQGVHWVVCANAGLDNDYEGKRVFRNPVVRRIINAACEAGLCYGTTATKEEIADFYTQRMRSPVLPDSVRDNAADKLAKMMGYYPKSEGGQGSVNVQINCINPYGEPVKAEVVDA